MAEPFFVAGHTRAADRPCGGPSGGIPVSGPWRARLAAGVTGTRPDGGRQGRSGGASHLTDGRVCSPHGIGHLLPGLLGGGGSLAPRLLCRARPAAVHQPVLGTRRRAE
jgi:hypothetical protein